MARDPRVEAHLAEYGAPYEYAEYIPLGEFDTKRGLGNQARLNGRALNDEAVEIYAESMRNGAAFPAVVVHRPLAGGLYVPMGGNHRLCAAKKSNRSGFDAYVVNVRDQNVIDRITRTLNNVEAIEGATRETRLAQAAYCVKVLNMKTRDAANKHGLTYSALQTYMTKDEVETGLAEAGIPEAKVSRSMAQTLRPLMGNHNVARVAYDIMIRGKLPEKDQKELVAAALAKHTERDQLDALHQFEKQPHIQANLLQNQAGGIRDSRNSASALRAALLKDMRGLRRRAEKNRAELRSIADDEVVAEVRSTVEALLALTPVLP